MRDNLDIRTTSRLYLYNNVEAKPQNKFYVFEDVETSMVVRKSPPVKKKLTVKFFKWNGILLDTQRRVTTKLYNV